MNRIIHGDCLQVLGDLPKARMVFADPPDNQDLKYDGFEDRWSLDYDYLKWLGDVFWYGKRQAPIFWGSYFHKWDVGLKQELLTCGVYPSSELQARTFIWRFTFGQHRKTDCGNGYRPILRVSDPGVKWNMDSIRVPSARQMKYNDRRANPDGRVPDDVWDFPRVCDTFHERRKWHPTQHPEALMERIILMSTDPGDLVIDMFGGSFTTARVCKKLDDIGQGRDCISIEISRSYCDKGAEELGCTVEGRI